MATETNAVFAKTFPGVYATITDRSFIQPQVSRFRAGLIGVARKGPFNTPVAVRSLLDFIRNFGQPLDGSHFLANAVAILAPLSDGAKVVRVANQYTSVGSVQAAGPSGGAILTSATNKGQIFSPASPPYGQGQNVFIRVKEPGKRSTVNVQVESASAGTISITGFGELNATYASADVAYSNSENAANTAESFLTAYTYGTIAGNAYDQPVTAAGSATGTKNNFQFTISGSYSAITAGDLLKIMQANKATTHEVLVKQVTPDGTVYLETSDRPDIGYQALPLQDSYATGSQIFKATGTAQYIFLEAASAGDWANGDDPTTGLYVKVRPGSRAGTKKFEVYEDGGQAVEVIDNLSEDPTKADFFVTRINGFSQYITVVTYANPANTLLTPANTASGWNANATPQLPARNVNAGGTFDVNTGGSFHNGFNGENASNADIVGSYDPATDAFTGIKAFEDSKHVQVDVLCVPGITDTENSISVHNELARVAQALRAVALVDIPSGLNLRQATDWHRGEGLFAGRGRTGTTAPANCAVYWNWFDITDPFTTTVKTVPPTLAALRCLAFTFDRDKPWYAAAGDNRGLLPEASTLEFTRYRDDDKQASYGNGSSVNGIFLDDDGQIKLFGERTMQIAESKLSVVHNVILVNYVVNNMSTIARRFVFEPNDPELLTRIYLALTQFLDTVKTERGIESYKLVIDSTNNTADTRNRREVIVDLALIPIDTAERIFINATVAASGADLNSLTAE